MLRGRALFFAERLSMRGRRVDKVRRAVPDMAVQDDQRGPARGLSKDGERALDLLGVVRVTDAQHVPPVGEKAGGDVLGEGKARAALDADVIVVVDPAQIVELEMAS